VGFGLVIFRRFFILFSLLILVACSSNQKVVRVPTPLLEMSSPYALEKQWQLQMDAFNAADSHGLYVAETAESVYFATPNGGLTKAKKANQPRWQDQVVWKLSYKPQSQPAQPFTPIRLLSAQQKGRSWLCVKVMAPLLG